MHPPASDIDAGAHFALSPYVGALRLSPSHLIVLHVLGRRRVIGGERLVAEVARFRCPTEVDPTSASKEFQALRLASVLQPVGNDETAWIKLAYARARRLARTEPFPSFLAPLCEVRNDAPCEADAIVGVRHAASESLAGIALDEGEHLVTHPAGTPTHLASDLWETLQSFRGGRPVGRADRHVAQFLMSRGLIWPSPEAEHNACLQAFALAAERLPELEITNRPGDLFRQIHRPNAVRDVDRPTVRKRIALVGPCLSQQFSECLEHHALRLGWSIETAAMLEPGPQLAHRQLDLVVLSAGQFVAHLVHFAGLGRWDDCEVLVERIVDAVRSRVVQTRELTNAPIAVAAARPPALGVFWPGSPEAYRLESMFARVNLELARATLAVGKAYMVDELDARERLMPGIYWDDRYNCAAHRAPLSSWNWVVLKPGRTDEPPPREADGLAPPARADQSDPAGASSLAVLELMVRLARRRRVDTVVFEPRGLLWPARRRPDDLERAGQRNFLVDVEDYWFAGVAEALSAVARRGIRLICLTGEDPADVNRGVAATAGTDTLLSREALAEIHCTLGKDEFIDDLLKRDREPGACVL